MSLQSAPDIVLNIEPGGESKVSWHTKIINAFIPVSKGHGAVLELVLHWEIPAGMAKSTPSHFCVLLGSGLWGKSSWCRKSPHHLCGLLCCRWNSEENLLGLGLVWEFLHLFWFFFCVTFNITTSETSRSAVGLEPWPVLGQGGWADFNPAISTALTWQHYCTIFIQINSFVQQGLAQGARGSFGMREFPFPGGLNKLLNERTKEAWSFMNRSVYIA